MFIILDELNIGTIKGLTKNNGYSNKLAVMNERSLITDNTLILQCYIQRSAL